MIQVNSSPQAGFNINVVQLADILQELQLFRQINKL